MENADVSVSADAMGGLGGIDALKKNLFGDNSELESGYASNSNWSMSHCHGTSSTSALSNSAKFSSSSFKKSLDLETISENNELKGLQETPTTQSMRTLNDFHINTPQNARSQLETTPKKGNYFAKCCGSRSGSKRKSMQNIRWPLDKSTPSSLFESIEENSENTFNDIATNAYNQSINVSPIKPHNNSNMIIQQSEKSKDIQRYPSGIESSTPKLTLKRTRTQSIIKPNINLADELALNRMLRKAQSFSPAKRSALRETNYQKPIEPDDGLFEANKMQTYNPAQIINKLSEEQFYKLTQQNKPFIFKTPTKMNKYVIDDDLNDIPISPTNQLNLKRSSAKKSQSRLCKEFTRKKTIKPTRQTPKKALGSLNESDILASLANNEADSNKIVPIADNDDSLMNISDLELSTQQNTSTNIQKSQATHSDTPIRDDFVKRNIRDEAIRTPTKRFEKCTSLNMKSSPEKEKFDIVYNHLPCTPPKHRQRRNIKRRANVDSPQLNEPSAKRKLLLHESVCEKQPLLVGIEKLDILTQLSKRTEELLKRIFDYLPDESLQVASSVCTSWRALININPTIRNRRNQFLKAMQMNKENVRQHSIKPNIINNNNIKPLHIHNINYKDDEKPVLSVSPATQMFNEHQQIIRNLEPGQHVGHCPRCNGLSIVHPAKGPTGTTMILRSSPQRIQMSNNIANRAKRSKRVTKFIVSEYATCMRLACGFEFCTNCNGDRHVDAKCNKRPLGSSPKSDEDSPYKMNPPHNTRRVQRQASLRRLKF